MAFVLDKLCYALSLGLSKNVKYKVFGRALVVRVSAEAGRRPQGTQERRPPSKL